jgi:isopentenyl diphosphate isomerase/L-lactate dehydrogenase-like FMN-dependent dehydrogenase
MQPVNLLDYEQAAREVLPQAAFDFIAGAAEDELTLRANRAAFARIKLVPRVLVDVSSVDLSTEVIGQRISWPVLLAPVATQRIAHPDGELATARAAAARNTVMVLSSFSTYSIEDVAAAAAGPRWFQLYFQEDRALTRELVQRAEAAGYQAVCLTVDVPQLGNRERDLRNRLLFPADILPANFARNLDVTPYEALDPALASQVAGLVYPALSWADIDWLRSITRLPLLLKGILSAEDARLAVEHGVDGIVVSNHGGRQLDGVPASIEALPEVAEAVAGRAGVLLDSGVRRGTDVLKALALGARAVLLGRPFMWGLAVDGERGVGRVLHLLRAELELAMRLAGLTSVTQVTGALVRR